MTTTDVAVSTKPALEMKSRLADDPRADRPCTTSLCGATCTGLIAGAASATPSAALAVMHAASAATHARRKKLYIRIHEY